MHGLRDLRVVDLSTGIAGGYATKLLADAGADVIKVEPPEGDPLRRWSASGAELGGEDGALFRFLAGGKRSVAGAPGDAEVEELFASADLVVESFPPAAFDPAPLLARHPGLVVLSITPFGRSGPFKHHPWTEFTLQALSGSIGTRGLPGGEPFQAGGRIPEWVGGTYAAVAGLAAVWRAGNSGHGEHVDFSLLEAMTLAGTNYLDLAFRLLGIEKREGLPQSVETPSIEPTADGYVGFCTNSRQQVSDFMLLIERPELREDRELAQVQGRLARFQEWNEIVHAFTREHTTAEIRSGRPCCASRWRRCWTGRGSASTSRWWRGACCARTPVAGACSRAPPTASTTGIRRSPARRRGWGSTAVASRRAGRGVQPPRASRSCPLRACVCWTSPPGGPAPRPRTCWRPWVPT